MSTDLRHLAATLEFSMVDAVDRLNQAEMDLLYVRVLDLEQRIEALHDVLALVAERIVVEDAFS